MLLREYWVLSPTKILFGRENRETDIFGYCGTPWLARLPRPLVDVFVFVHRVVGMEPGLYLLHRSGNGDLLDALETSSLLREAQTSGKLLSASSASSRSFVRIVEDPQKTSTSGHGLRQLVMVKDSSRISTSLVSGYICCTSDLMLRFPPPT